MGWHPPVPAAILDADNTEWQVIRSWPDDSAEDYVLELAAPGPGRGPGSPPPGGAAGAPAGRPRPASPRPEARVAAGDGGGTPGPQACRGQGRGALPQDLPGPPVRRSSGQARPDERAPRRRGFPHPGNCFLHPGLPHPHGVARALPVRAGKRPRGQRCGRSKMPGKNGPGPGSGSIPWPGLRRTALPSRRSRPGRPPSNWRTCGTQ